MAECGDLSEGQIFVGDSKQSTGVGQKPTQMPLSTEQIIENLRNLQGEVNVSLSPADPIDAQIAEIKKRNEENYQKLIALLFLNSENGQEALFSRPQQTSSVEELYAQSLGVYTGLYDLVGEKVDTVGQLIDCIHPDDRERIINELMAPQSSSNHGARQFDFRLRKQFPDRDTDGNIIFNEEGRIQYSKPPEWRYVRYAEKPYTASDGVSQQWVCKLTDISEMADRMFHDQLTGVNNLRFFETFVRDKVVEMLHGDRNFAMLMVDINKLKPPNDYIGHEAGDKLLKDMIRILKKCLRDSDIICRVGGDEIFVLMERIRNTGDLEEVLNRVQTAFNDNPEYIHAEITESPPNPEIISAWLNSGSIELEDMQNQPNGSVSLPVGTKVRIRPMVSIGACSVFKVPHPENDAIFNDDPLKLLQKLADRAMNSVKNLRLKGTHYDVFPYMPEMTDEEREGIKKHKIELS